MHDEMGIEMDKTNVRRAVGAIIGWKDHPGQIVLVKKIKTEDIGKADIPPEWDIPKGGIKPGEGLDKALWRELREEVGCEDFKLVKQLPFRMDFQLPQGLRWTRQETTLFLLEYQGLNRNFSPQTTEIEEARFFSVEEMRKFVRYETTIKAVEEAQRLGALS
jgi:putative (di)nucleoside polyphosphate hydrolase